MVRVPSPVLSVLIPALLLLSTPRAGTAQYMYLDTNGNGVNDPSDFLHLGCPTAVDIWLDTERNRAGDVVTCDTGDGPLTLNSYEVILEAVGGTVSWESGSFTNLQSGMSPFGGPTWSNTGFHAAYLGGTYLAPGKYKLASVQVEPVSGSPTIRLGSGSDANCRFATSFGTECSGALGDATYRLGSDWVDADGTGPPADLAPPVVTAPATAVVEETFALTFGVSVYDCEPIDSLAADLSALPPGNNAVFSTSIDRTSGALTWTPGESAAGTYPVTFLARNAQSGTATTMITVENVTTLVPYGASGFRFQEFGQGTPYPPGIETVGFDDASFPQGPAPFTDNSGCVTATAFSPWAPNSNLAVRRRIILGSEVANAKLRYLIDNDVSIYVNGTFVRGQVHDGCAQYGDFTEPIPGGLLHQGENVLVALCADRGASTYFDLWLTAQDTGPVISAADTLDILGGAVVSQGVTAADPEGDPIASLTADLSGLPPGNDATFASNPDHTAGTFSWTTAVTDSGVYPVAFAASNALTGVRTTLYRLTPSDHAPVVTAPAAVEGEETVPLTVAVSASDPDGDPLASLIADWSSLPLGNDAAFSTGPPYTSGTLTWTPTSSDSGSYGVTFTASNALTGRASTLIHVANRNHPPAFTPTPPQAVWENEPLACAIVASDPDGDALAYSLVCGPPGSGYEPETHVFAWIPPFTSGRYDSACVSASDGTLADTTVVPIEILDVPPGPRIVAVTDVTADQGRQVDVHWKRSEYDAPGDGVVVTGYALYRRIDPLPALAGRGARGAPLPAGGLPQRQAQFPPGEWQYVLTAPARLETDYHVVAPTLADSTRAAGMHETTFFVSALTADVESFYDGAPDSGYSVDNLVPSVPEGLLARSLPGPTVSLLWQRVRDEDARYYSIHRGDTPDFVIDGTNRIGSTADTTFLDPNPGITFRYYAVAAVDFAGNVGLPAVVGINVTDVLDQSPPRAFTLAPPRPNPASSVAAIAFALPHPGAVTLEILSTDGRLVRRIVREPLDAGPYERLWDLRDESGRRVATGVYVYRITLGGRSLTRKMAVLR